MAQGDIYLYDLIHCNDPTLDRLNQATSVNPSPFVNQIVYIDVQPQADTYKVTPVTPPADGLNAGLMAGWMPVIFATNLTSCADPNIDKMYKVTNCNDVKDVRYVLHAAAQTIGDILRYVGECTCWRVAELVSTYTETLVIDTTFSTCALCLKAVTAENCLFEERTIGRAVRIKLPAVEKPDRGFQECCYSNLVFGDVVDTASYKNDFSSVFFQKQTSTDTVAFEIIPASTGVPVALVDVTHGTLYPFDPTGVLGHHNPNLSYFIVKWRDILSALGEDVYTIRMAVTIAGVGPTNIDSNSFKLQPFSVVKADHTARIDTIQDGTLEKIGVDFKESGYTTSLRVQGYFGNAQDNVEQDNVVFSSKKGKAYYSDQITMSNNPEYTFQANNIPECISRQLRKEAIFANEIFISDYNLNNHSYEYELLPVEIAEIAANDYPIEGRGVNISMTFADRSKDNRKTNC